MGRGGGGGDSGKPGVSEAASLVFGIATVGLSLASAITTAASTGCVQSGGGGGCPAGAVSVSYSDYNSFKFSALAELLSAVLQGVAIYLEVVGKEKAAKAVELIDKLVLALTSSSAALLLAVDDITSCGPPRGGGSRRQQRSSVCSQGGGRFCGKVKLSSVLSLAATVSASASIYTRHVRLRVPKPRPRHRPFARRETEAATVGSLREKAEEKKVEEEEKKKEEEEEEKKKKEAEEEEKKKKKEEDNECCTVLTPPTYCGCPCGCENPELCGAFFFFFDQG